VFACENPAREAASEAAVVEGAVVEEAALVEQINISIPSTREVDETYVTYAIHVHVAGVEWTVERRFREFIELNRRVQKAFPKIKLPVLRQKWRRATPEDVELRRHSLTEYLGVVVSMHPTRHFPPLRDFLEWDHHRG
jgi:hypothetical protein